METHPSKKIPMDYGDDKEDTLTDDRIRYLLSSESDLKAYISHDPPEAYIKTLLSQASKLCIKESMKIILHYIVQQFTERFSENEIQIWAGEEVIGPENVQTVLVCFHSGSCDTSMKSFYDLKVIYRDYNTTDGESALARAREREIKCYLTSEECALVKEAITTHGEGLFAKHSNLEVMSSSGILSSNSRGLLQEPCVILYCRLKGIIPFGEMRFPKSFKVNEDASIAVDVREGYFSSCADSRNNDQENTFHHKNQQQMERLRMGCKVGPANSLKYGTMGPFVQINSDKIGFLTCAHVVFSDDELINLSHTSQMNRDIVQHTDGDLDALYFQENLPVCGRVCDAVLSGDWSLSSTHKFGIDAAVIEITSRFPNAGEFVPIKQSQLEDAGFSLDQPPRFETGNMKNYPIDWNDKHYVIKIGSISGLTRGSLRPNECIVKYSNLTTKLVSGENKIEKIMHQLMEISPAHDYFSKDGDSGAGVFLVDQNRTLFCVGLLFGWIENDGTSLAIPIDIILKALCRDGQSIELKQF